VHPHSRCEAQHACVCASNAMRALQFAVLVALVVAYDGYCRYGAEGAEGGAGKRGRSSPLGGVDAGSIPSAGKPAGGEYDEVSHVPEGTSHDASSSDALHTHDANRIHIEYCSG